MIKLQAINNAIILLKDKKENNSPLILPETKSESIYSVPEPYSGIIDTIGDKVTFENMDKEEIYKIGDHVSFDSMGGIYMKVDDKEYVVITPNLIMGKYD